MAKVGKRKENWYLDWRDPVTGKRSRPSLGPVSEKEAQLALKALEVELEAGQQLTKRGRSAAPMIGPFATEYLAWYEPRYPSSSDRTDGIVARFVRQFAHLRIDQFAPKLIEDYITRRMRTKTRGGKILSGGTVSKEVKAIKAMFARAVDWKMLPVHPFLKVEAPSDLRSKVPGYYKPEQLAALYAADATYAHMWQFMVNTGLRRGEALKAKRADIVSDKVRSFILIESDPEGAGRTKSGKLRKVPLNAAALHALEFLGEDYLLPRMVPRSLTRAFARSAKRAELLGSIHWTRHTFCTSLLLAGASIRDVQAMAGHASITTTEKYLASIPEHHGEAVDRIGLVTNLCPNEPQNAANKRKKRPGDNAEPS